MKKHLCLLSCLAGLALNSAMGQQMQMVQPTQMVQSWSGAPAAESKLTKFNLDFPGGTPKELVAAIQKAMGKPLNVIVPDQFAHLRLPALKMNDVSVARLFAAMEAVSVEVRSQFTPDTRGFGTDSDRDVASPWLVRRYSFRTTDQPPTDDSIWTFYVVANPTPSPALPGRICRFYSLSPYLERGLTVDDITTAIEAGWKMLGLYGPGRTAPDVSSLMPAIRFHKETKLLIAVGEASKLETIDAVLKALAPAAAPPAEKPKTGK